MAFYFQFQMHLNLWLIVLMIGLINTMKLAAASLPRGCPDSSTCGHLNVPYPCSTIENCTTLLGDKFLINCLKSSDSDHPIPLLWNSNIVVANISLDGELEVMQYVAKECYDITAKTLIIYKQSVADFSISETKNKFVAVGCDTQATINGQRGNSNYTTGCISSCQESDLDSLGEACSGVGCCQISIPKGLNKNIEIQLTSFYNREYVAKFNPCSSAFIVDKDKFKFNSTIVRSRQLAEIEKLPMVIDWSIENVSCDEAPKLENYSCKANSKCVNSTTGSGYICQWSEGYKGNPYLPHGCQDIDECEKHNPCINGTCRNTPGSFNCSCGVGYTPINRTTCSVVNTPSNSGRSTEHLILDVSLSVCMGVIVFTASSIMIFWILKKRKLIKIKEKFFQQNGGKMLQQKLSSHGGSLDTTKIFSIEELKKATNNFHESRILGEGGYGTVYKGELDNKLVAIKKSKVGVQPQSEKFINEVVVLMQINHKNVVKLFGCCLETEVPLLVYEFISNGTLFDRIHCTSQEVPPLSWNLRLKLALETAGALAYLHCQTITQIIHRDVKTANILLDDNYTAKVSDFGASRLNPLDQNQLQTIVQGTFGYLDPEYMHSSKLTDKSDVYSFGVVLAEILTRKKALAFDRPEKDRNLAKYFVSALKDGTILDILDVDIVKEENVKVLMEVANLAGRCLRLKGEKRPSMKEVAMELEGLRTIKKHPQNEDYWLSEEEYLLEPLVSNSIDIINGESSSSTIVSHVDMQNKMLTSYGDG
ncbi:wall-associated receptor kinase 2-like [Humulus lupulus]|uniref:wall-associated receptor kinase 2-like n=1 Tax=Humulus lupulus TaxID=3486 RepID=UPI002B410EE4|nr:wall-associated receptor kinase 2-like [Humulus lupulus]